MCILLSHPWYGCLKKYGIPQNHRYLLPVVLCFIIPHRMKSNTQERVYVYVDWFNLYHAISKLPWYRKYLWLDLRVLATQFLQSWQVLKKVSYFTAYSRRKPDKELRHKQYVSALNDHGVTTILWNFQKTTKTFYQWKTPLISILFQNIIESLSQTFKWIFVPLRLDFQTFEEKKTDVNLAISILEDGLMDRYDTAIIISWDSDLVPPIDRVKKLKGKKFILVMPPNGKWTRIRQVCDTSYMIKEIHLSSSQLPSVTWKHKRPSSWI